jgi:DNA-binding response OmpR family regulator/two-component sensor histidine kinase
MQTLIQQLIDFRKAETGYLRLEIEQVNIPELVTFVLDNFMEILEQKKIQLTLDFNPKTFQWQTDRDSIEKILFNLVSNAVKYTPEEENITVLVETKENRLFIRVTNTGVGIKPEYQQSIFDRFEVLERFEMQVSKGIETRNGIGLALCKNIVEVLHGTIEVLSDGLTYTSFIVSVPEELVDQSVVHRKREVKSISTPTDIPEEDKQTEKNRFSIPDVDKEGLILVIDDEKEIRELLNDFLSDRYEVEEAANGREAIELMRIRMPMLIVCDIIMPEMNGVEFVKIMKQQELSRHIPIILLSSKSSVESQIEGLETGADAYLNKPFHPRHLEAIIESLLHRNKAILEYSESTYAALEQYEGKLIHKEDKELMLRITRIIHEHLDNDSLTLDFIANETAISKMQLYRKMKDLIGQTPTEYIRSIRLKQAEKLLKITNKTVQEIMYTCGFNNKAYFYREFAKKYHLTPKEYRSQN